MTCTVTSDRDHHGVDQRTAPLLHPLHRRPPGTQNLTRCCHDSMQRVLASASWRGATTPHHALDTARRLILLPRPAMPVPSRYETTALELRWDDGVALYDAPLLRRLPGNPPRPSGAHRRSRHGMT